jgi:hypothetical protein
LKNGLSRDEMRLIADISGKYAKRFVRLLARKRERIEVRERT